MKNALVTSTLVFALAAVIGLSSRADVRREGHTVKIAEAEERAAQMFDRVDANGDDEISPQELSAMAEKRHGHHRQHGEQGRHWDKMRAMRGMSGEPPEAMPERAEAFRGEIFQGLDTNGDHQLSEEEFSKAREVTRSVIQQHAFSVLDSNADGRLSRDEFPGFINRMKALDSNGDGELSPLERRAAFEENSATQGDS